jgi:hypothetical protein
MEMHRKHGKFTSKKLSKKSKKMHFESTPLPLSVAPMPQFRYSTEADPLRANLVGGNAFEAELNDVANWRTSVSETPASYKPARNPPAWSAEKRWYCQERPASRHQPRRSEL